MKQPTYQDPNFALVEGGQWLLIVDAGRVFAQDLDVPLGREPELIIETQTQDLKCLYHLCVDVDCKEPILTFNLSFLPIRTEIGPSTLQIYRVHLTGHGKDAKLVFKPLNRLLLTLEGRSQKQDVSGNYFVRTFLPFNKTRLSCVEVYDWNPSNQATQFVVSKTIVPLPVSQFLLIFCWSWAYLTTMMEEGYRHPPVIKNSYLRRKYSHYL